MSYPMSSNGNTLFIGTTRSGKTTAMLHVIQRSIRLGEPVFIISGKTGFNDRYSMYNQVQALCHKYDRKFYAISTNRNAHNKFTYNPFKYADIQGVADTMKSMAQFSDTYYESAFEFWVIVVNEIIDKANILRTNSGEMPIQRSLPNIMRFFNWNSFKKAILELKKYSVIDTDEEDEYLSYKQFADVAWSSAPRFLKFLRGNSGSIFKGKDPVSVMDAKKEGAVFMLDLDGLMYKDFSHALGAMAISDLRTMISLEDDVESRKLIVLDELSVFFSELLPDIYSQASGFGYQPVAGSQSFSDMDRISPDLAERMIENTQIFGFLLQNSAKDCERCSQIMGTRKSSEVTRRLEGSSFEGTGSSKVIQKFKVHPDKIRALPPLHMFVYDKSRPEDPQLIKWDFLDLDLKSP